MPTTPPALCLAAAAAACLAVAATDDETPVEFGRIDWGRELAPALETAQQTGKPVLLLFQEVPG